MFATAAAQFGAIFVVLVCGFAFLKGDEPERIGAGAFVLGWFTSLITQPDGPHSSVNVGMMIADFVMLAVLIGLTWKAHRGWPAWAAACQLLVVMSHLIALTDLRSSAGAVITIINLAGYGVLVALAAGTFWAWQERRVSRLD